MESDSVKKWSRSMWAEAKIVQETGAPVKPPSHLQPWEVSAILFAGQVEKEKTTWVTLKPNQAPPWSKPKGQPARDSKVKSKRRQSAATHPAVMEKTGILCKYQTARYGCKYGRWCNSTHNESWKPCYHFTRGNCKFGKACTFSHETKWQSQKGQTSSSQYWQSSNNQWEQSSPEWKPEQEVKEEIEEPAGKWWNKAGGVEPVAAAATPIAPLAKAGLPKAAPPRMSPPPGAPPAAKAATAKATPKGEGC